jgi:hypothetical protein
MQLSGNFNALVAYPQGKKPRYLLDKRLSGFQSRSGIFQKEKISCPCQKSNDSWGYLPVAWSPYRQSYPCSNIMFIAVIK